MIKNVNLSKFLEKTRVILTKHSPEILTGLGVAGTITSVILAVKATPKALLLLENEKNNNCSEKELTNFEKIKVCWKCYIPAASTEIISIMFLIGANSINAKRNAVLAAAYTIAENASKEYRSKVIETIGEKKDQLIKDKVAKDKIEKDPVENHKVIMTDKGNILCYESLSGRYFKGDIEKIKKSVNELNRKMMYTLGGYISLNELYQSIGLDNTSLGEELGWNIEDGLLELDLSSQLTKSEEPCLVINYSSNPKYEFSSSY